MSYILEALRKAEAERQRGAVPGLHAQALPVAELPTGRAGAGRRLVAGLVGAVLLLCAAGGAWWCWSVARAPKVTPTAVPALPTTSPAAPAEATQTVPPPVPVAAPGTQPSVPTVSAPPPAAVTMADAPAQKSQPAPAPTPATVPAPVPPATAPASPAAPAVPALQEPPVRLADLPEARRRELPPLVLSGAVQSPDPAARMLIVDGQVLREGDALSPGLTLERIGPRAAVFSLRGLRFELPL